ncbi:MAG: hypothetical protein RL095_1243 [Verrucomicrobiota bacterium]|jgi:hypothetical protein
MKRILCSLALLACSCLAADTEPQGESLFNGKDLSGWEGNPGFWKVEDGAITAESGGANPCKKTTFLVLKDRVVADFEITFKFRFLSDWGNSGLQFRSKLADAKTFDVTGYQADMEMGKQYTGILYEQGGRGIFVNRGDRKEVDAAGKAKVTAHFDTSKVAQLEKGRWYTYRVVAQGSHLIQEIDGVRTMECIDEDAKHRAASGILALQLHAGPAMKAQFKDIVLKEIKSAATKP